MTLRPLLTFLPLIFVASACGSARSAPPTSVPRSVALARPQVAIPLAGSYVAMGASETFGVGAIPFSRGYAYLVAHALHARHFRDVGIPGATLHNAYDTEMQETLASRPVLVTAFFGYNDIGAQVPLSAFLQDLQDLALTLRTAHAKLLIVGLPDLSLVPSAAPLIKRFHLNITAWNRGMHRVTTRTGARFLDLSSFARELAQHREYIASDGLHPSNRGHARLAQVVVAAIRRDGLWRFR